jgi:hypothetical protein
MTPLQKYRWYTIFAINIGGIVGWAIMAPSLTLA